MTSRQTSADSSLYEEDDDDHLLLEDDDDDHHVISQQPSVSDDDLEKPPQCMEPAELIGDILASIDEVNQIFQVSRSTARSLLAYFKWDKERLLERYYGGDSEALLREAHCVVPGAMSPSQSSDHQEYTCNICFCSYLASELKGIECGHKFCDECWNSYLRIKIMGEGVVATSVIECPAVNCHVAVDELTISGLIHDAAVLKKYEYLVAKTFVQGNRHIKWCPAPGCENAVKSLCTKFLIKARPVTCKCGNTFCFKCEKNWHEPLSCELLTTWLKKCSDDSETSNWISANTKLCPKCKATIEKNGGCNHMVCRTGGCKYEFCWMCLGPWEPHGSAWYNCNRFDEKDGVEARSSQSKSRESLERYLFYFDRYQNHENSKRLEKKLVAAVESKMAEWQATVPGCTWQDVRFLADALKVLTQCRETLKYTYGFAYYLAKNNHAEIFESNQKDLEVSTEHLSGYLEFGSSSDSFTSMKQKVLDKVAYCKQRRTVLLEHVKEGQLAHNWVYRLESVQRMMDSCVDDI